MVGMAGMGSTIDGIDLDHVAVAAERMADGWPRYAGDLAGEWLAGGGTPGFYSAQVRYANGMKVEVLEPFEIEQNDFLRRFLDRNGPGAHHVTYKVADIVAALELVEAAGYRPVSVNLSDPQWKEAFIHPKDAPGIVVQLAQSGGEGEWISPPPEDFPAPRTAAPSTLVHVGHAVASVDVGLSLFRDLLSGQETARGEDEGARWVDLAWPGPGRIRLLQPTSPSSPLAAWIGDRKGRVHHLRFSVEDAAAIADATPLAGGMFEVVPERNLGVRLVLADVSNR
jgi:catechol 2,3-dioxygenase-like lactoylglutathione lyase family enzyme